MSYDWNDKDANVAALLTSHDFLERTAGKVYCTLRNDANNTETGNNLFVKMCAEEIRRITAENLNQYCGKKFRDYHVGRFFAAELRAKLEEQNVPV